MNLDQARQTFVEECSELLQDMETSLLSLAQDADSDEAIRVIFRAAHTIKGSAGLFGLDAVVAFTHDLESVLDRVRDGVVAINPTLVQLLLASRDHVALLLAHSDASANGDAIADDEPEGLALTSALRTYLPASPPASAHDEHRIASLDAGQNGQPAVRRSGSEDESQRHGGTQIETKTGARNRVHETKSQADSDRENWHLSLRFGRDVLRNGLDPLSFIRYLAKIADIVDVDVFFDGAVDLNEVDAESCYLGFEIAFRSDADKQTLLNVFEFVQDDCRIRILQPRSRIDEYVELIRELPDRDDARLGELLIRAGTLTAPELETALRAQANAAHAPLIGELLVEAGAVEPTVVAAALAKQQRAKDVKMQESRSVRVDADKLDRLIDLVGELITSSAGIGLAAHRSSNAELKESMSHFVNLVQDVRDSALQLRMVKIGSTFKKFERVVHDVAASLGKKIVLRTAGEDTELDKTVVEKIGDPLMHLMRNAMDHGIEDVVERLARGKAAEGTVSLNAYHEASNIVIEVSDDGGGLRKDRILEKAVQRGLIDPGVALSEKEIFDLIFEPGFSTAEAVSTLSGRGVGMDVVKSNILALRGTVAMDSREGVGTTVKVTLPLTLAMIDGFLVQVGESMFVLPLSAVDECIAFAPVPDRLHEYLDLRGGLLPYARLGELFAIQTESARRENVVVIRHGSVKLGIVVDKLLGEFQAVIKPMNEVFKRNPLISGSAILGDGGVALIVDTVQVIANLEKKFLSAA